MTASSGAPTISGFTPAIAAVGSPLTINGTNYDPVPANDRVTMNVAFVSPTSVTATAIDATVPAAATSGKITVTTPIGTAVRR